MCVWYVQQYIKKTYLSAFYTQTHIHTYRQRNYSCLCSAKVRLTLARCPHSMRRYGVNDSMTDSRHTHTHTRRESDSYYLSLPKKNMVNSFRCVCFVCIKLRDAITNLKSIFFSIWRSFKKSYANFSERYIFCNIMKFKLEKKNDNHFARSMNGQ